MIYLYLTFIYCLLLDRYPLSKPYLPWVPPSICTSTVSLILYQTSRPTTPSSHHSCPGPVFPLLVPLPPIEYPGLGRVSLILNLYVSPWGMCQRLFPGRTSHEASGSVELSTSYRASCHHHALLWLTTHSKPCSCVQNSSIGIKSTHCSNIHYLQLMYLTSIKITAALNTFLADGVAHVPSVFLRSLFPVIYLRKIIWVTSAALVITYDMYHASKPNNRTACTRILFYALLYFHFFISLICFYFPLFIQRSFFKYMCKHIILYFIFSVFGKISVCDVCVFTKERFNLTCYCKIYCIYVDN